MEDLGDALGFSGMVYLKGMVPTSNRGLKCPNDHDEMRAFKLPICGEQLALDRCPTCDSIWFHNIGKLLNAEGELRQEVFANQTDASIEQERISPISQEEIRKLALAQLQPWCTSRPCFARGAIRREAPTVTHTARNKWAQP